ncbi:MAG TPA: DoxX family protein [Actinomycetota bacterium]|nr:DoxX family protein [Actinomycetota bacterium]
MRDLLKLFTRLVLGAYMVVHGSQKLFGAFGGPGPEKAGAGFEAMGLRPGKEMATLAGATEVGGGILTATGLADPLGPMMIMGSMSVATVSHRSKGPMAAKGGFELPLTNFALAALVAAAGPGRFAIHLPLPKKLLVAAAAGGGALAGISLAQLLRARPPAPAVPERDSQTASARPSTGKPNGQHADPAPGA